MGESLDEDVADDEQQQRTGEEGTEVEQRAEDTVIGLPGAGKSLEFHLVYHSFP